MNPLVTAGLCIVLMVAGLAGLLGWDWWGWLMFSEHWPARWFCGTWSPGLGWSHIVADLVTWASYMGISALVLFHVRYLTDRWARALGTGFFLFVFCCGLTHLVDASIFWRAHYRLSVSAKLVTASISGPVFVVFLVLTWTGHVSRVMGVFARQRQYRQMLEVTFLEGPDGMAWVRADRHPERANPALCRMLGYTEEELRGMPFDAFTHPEHVGIDVDLYRQALSGSLRTYHLRKKYIHKGGREVWGALSVRVLPEPVDKVMAIAHISDVSAIVASEQQLRERTKLAEGLTRSLEARVKDAEEIAYSVSHDLKQPLRALQQRLQRLQQKGAAWGMDKTLEELVPILASARRAHQLLESMHEVLGAEINKHGQSVVRTVMQGVLEDVSVCLDERGATVECFGVGAKVPMDEGSLARVLQNVIVNAVKHCPLDRAPHVELVGRWVNGRYRLAVIDNGPGIPRDNWERVFLPFERGVAEEGEGVGIGLAICRKLLRQAGGGIWVERSDATGTTFVVDLPAPSTEAWRELETWG